MVGWEPGGLTVRFSRSAFFLVIGKILESIRRRREEKEEIEENKHLLNW